MLMLMVMWSGLMCICLMLNAGVKLEERKLTEFILSMTIATMHSLVIYTLLTCCK